MSEDVTNNPMLGIYTLDEGVPVDPQIILTNCRDAAMLGQLKSVFGNTPDIGFFLVPEENMRNIDPTEDIYFVSHNGNWVLSQGNTMTDVLFDNPGFNPGGAEGTFSLTQADAGSWAVHASSLPPGGQLLAETPDGDIFGVTEAAETEEAETFFIDPSVLEPGKNEIVLDNFQLGVDTLELSDELAVKDVVVDSVNDLTEVILEREAHPGGTDIVVRLLGVDPADIGHEAPLDLATSDDVDRAVQHIIDSGKTDLS